MTLDANDKKIEAGKRTSFCVYLDNEVEKYQDVPFACTLKKLTVFFDNACLFDIKIEVKIDEKVVVRARGDKENAKFELEEAIYPNSRVSFKATDLADTSGWHALIYGEIVC